MQHIRKTNAGGIDRRHRTRLHGNNLAPTACGAEPTHDDIGRSAALNRIANNNAVGHRPDSPKWLAGICPDCIAQVSK